MAIEKLSAAGIKRSAEFRKPGRYGDGGGLYLQVANGGTRAWLFQYSWQGRIRQMGLGSYVHVSLADARKKAKAARDSLGGVPCRPLPRSWGSVASRAMRSEMTRLASILNQFVGTPVTERSRTQGDGLAPARVGPGLDGTRPWLFFCKRLVRLGRIGHGHL